MCWAYKWQHWAQWLSSFRLYLSSPLWTLSVIPDPFLSNYSTLFYLPVTLSMSYLVSLSSLVLMSKCSTKRGLPFKMRLYVIICLSFCICKIVKYYMKKYRNGKFWKQMWIYFWTFNIKPNLDAIQDWKNHHSCADQPQKQTKIHFSAFVYLKNKWSVLFSAIWYKQTKRVLLIWKNDK